MDVWSPTLAGISEALWHASVNVSMRFVIAHQQRRSEFLESKALVVKGHGYGRLQLQNTITSKHMAQIQNTSGSFITFPQGVKEAATSMQVINISFNFEG